MQAKSQRIDIGGEVFFFTPFSVSVGLVLMQKVMRLIVPALMEITSGLSGASIKSVESLMQSDAGAAIGAFAKAIEKLITGNSPEANTAMIKELLQTTRDGSGLIGNRFDVVFQGRYLLLFKLAATIISLEFNDFLSESGLGMISEKIMGWTQARVTTLESQ